MMVLVAIFIVVPSTIGRLKFVIEISFPVLRPIRLSLLRLEAYVIGKRAFT